MHKVFKIFRFIPTGKWAVTTAAAEKCRQTSTIKATLFLAGIGAAGGASAGSIYLNDGNNGACINITDGSTNITHQANGTAECNVRKITDTASMPAGTLFINGPNTFLKGNLWIDGAFDLNAHKVSSLAAGTNAADAVNLGQLTPLLNALGGNAEIDARTGAVTGPSYSLIHGGTQTTVAGALIALDDALSTASTRIAANAINITHLQRQLNGDSIGGTSTDGHGAVLGRGASASGDLSTAIGSNATANASNAVALGADSSADRAGTVSVGSKGNERQITNVAAGTLRTDAANWGQVQNAVRGVQDWATRKFEQVDGRIDRMGAMSAAYSQMAFGATGLNTPNRVGVGVGMQGGESAVALGVSHRFSPNINVSFGGSASGREASVGAGMAIGW